VWRSPTVLITIGAVFIALAVIAILNNRPGPATGSGSTGTPAPAASGATSAVPNVAVTAPGSPLPDTVTRDGRTLGASTAKVALDVWEDFQCPACGSFSTQIEPVLVDRYVVPGQLKITYHDYAFIGQESQDASSAARCAGQQGKFWEFHDYLFANQNGENRGWFTRDRFLAIADKIGLDEAAFQACYDGGSQRQAVTAETQSGTAAGVASTPTLILDGRTLSLSSYSSWADFLGDIDRTIIAAGGSIAPSSPTPAASPSS
jgi:protein-disulfide isomerase